MSKVDEIVLAYLHGEKTLEETNEALREEKAGFSINPDKQTITPEEAAQGDARSGFGRLDDGVGYREKVEIKDMQLVHSVGDALAFVHFNGKIYKVAEDGKTLIE